MPFLAEKSIKLPFSTNLKSDEIGWDKPPKSDIPGGGWGGWIENNLTHTLEASKSFAYSADVREMCDMQCKKILQLTLKCLSYIQG